MTYPDPQFWLAAAGAGLFKALFSKRLTLWGALLTMAVALFSAWVFTEPIALYLDISSLKVKYALAALIALTGEQAMRAIIDGTGTPERIIDLWHYFRSGKK